MRAGCEPDRRSGCRYQYEVRRWLFGKLEPVLPDEAGAGGR